MTWIILVVVQVVVHVPWQDEFQAWLIVLTSDSLAELFVNLRNDGHPGLWYLVLWAASQASRDPLILQLIGALCATGFAALVWFRSPFGYWESVGILFGYFVVFEYASFARSYALGMLLFGLSALHISSRARGWGATLGLLANTSVYGLACAGLLVCERLVQDSERISMRVRELIIFSALAILSALTMAPADDTLIGHTSSGTHPLALLGKAIAILRAWTAPIPPWSDHFWPHLHQTPRLIVAALTLCLTIALSRPMRHVAWVFCLLTFATLFSSVIYGIFLRHVGNLWLFVITLAWISRAASDVPRVPRMAFSAVLSTHVIGSIVALLQFFSHPLSRARDVAAFLQENFPSEPLLAEDDTAAVGISAFMHARPIIGMARMEPGTYVIRDRQRSALPARFVEINAAQLHQDFPDGVFILASDRGPRFSSIPGIEFIRLASFDDAIIENEVAYIYVFADRASR